MLRYGFIGLGNLGKHLANNLLKAGFKLYVHDINKALAVDLIKAGAIWTNSPQEIVAQVDGVFTCLPSPTISKQVLTQIIAGHQKGQKLTWIEMSTVGREDILALSKMATDAGIDTLELPVTGGVHLAARGEITLLVGGDQAIFDLHKPALEFIGDKIFLMGPIGSAALIKVITNMLAFIHLVADGEALMLAKRGGLDLAKSWAAIQASSGNSFVHETEGQLILNGSYDIDFTMDLALKDLGFALGFGAELGVPLDLAGVTQQSFRRGKSAYGGQAQSTMIVKLLEDLLKTDLRAEGFPAKLV